MISTQITTQKENSVNGDLVGGNKISYNFGGAVVLSGEGINALYAKYKKEACENLNQAIFSEKLQHYFKATTETDVRGIEEKLIDSNRQQQIPLAKELKERAAKAIMKHQSSHSAQTIYTFILDELHTNYELTVTPIIQGGAQRQAVDQAIFNVLQETRKILGENIFEITQKDLFGFLFFLGGNCHIRWDKC